MSRTKKSRKPAAEPRAKPKLSKEALANVEKRVRKKTGKKPGNRQQEALQKSNVAANPQNKDPRIGSKKPIELGVTSQSVEQAKAKASKPNKAAQQTIAAIRYAEPEQNLAEQLAAIEADQQLQLILAKQADELALSAQEIDYFNDLMERHQRLSEALGIEDDDPEDVSSKAKQRSEDDLWDKLDNVPDDLSELD